MMGRSHLLLGAAGYLIAESCAPGLGLHMGDGAELASGTLVASGAAMLPDLDHPSATVARSLGPVTWFLSRAVHTMAGGHRRGTHTVWAWALVTFLVWQALRTSDGPWVVLIVCIFSASLAMRVLTEADGVICLLLAAVFGGAATLAAGHHHSWLLVAVSLGYALHMLGDVVTTEGIPPFFPFGPNIAFPIIGTCDHWRERSTGALCGLVAFYLLVKMVFVPGWHAQTQAQAAPTPPVPAVVAPSTATNSLGQASRK
jgi:membrane-bound metal-dependent hydrolase YbcI (DUF457 family)